MKKSSEDPLKPEDKLEWVTPKISLMEADDCRGKDANSEETSAPTMGPS